ncbi:hypothetical protein WICPIJ_007427 [Wickerhamomyces pijperi]|uniref:Nuclear protein localization protein 4 n=1 Tax=Wickerhamomyces pijperi TaxID=599730 RepID=A0A9P8Q065_WICPI|nr:hypothetical protein WICPIJ_007427 [Wickerhamomyces pijperi]
MCHFQSSNKLQISSSSANNSVKNQILRFRAKDGLFRVNTDSDLDLATIIQQEVLSSKLQNPDPSTVQVAQSQSGPYQPIAALTGHTPASVGFRNGEMLFVKYEELPQPQQEANFDPQTQSATTISIPKVKINPSFIEELAVDRELTKEEGFIPRKRSKFCKHTDKGMCEYCSPLPPWDKGYREENSIKHASFHAHVKELNHNINKGQGSSYIAPLSESNFVIDKHCNGGHEPWPRGICSKCQPSAITLQQQQFRMVDHLEISNHSIVNNFIDSWRLTGTQRIGFMYGRYEKYDKVPLGIKAVVEAIYEPVQHGENDGLTLGLPWAEEQRIDSIAKKMGLVKIGVIFTDLTDAGVGDGSVICKRHKDSFFLSSLEVIFAAKLQKRYPNYTKFSDSGKFSSKFVTCVISGDPTGNIEVTPYQVSESAEALVTADMITGSTHPNMAYINETNNDRYVPEIFYSKINEYKLQVKTNAKPAFPVEYLLITLSHGFRKAEDDTSLFKAFSFPIENRQAVGISQDLSEIKKQLKIDSKDSYDVIRSLSDFHLLVYLFDLGILNDQEQDLAIKVATSYELEDAYRLIEQPGWRTLLTILRSS